MDTDDEQLIDSFTVNDKTSDVVLIVDEKKIYAHKSILGKIIIRRRWEKKDRLWNSWNLEEFRVIPKS